MKESHTWSWISTALERIKKIPFGTAVTAPILRYHPALIAQAFATMQAIHGPRVILGLGTGEAMNEIPLGFSWPPLPERRARLVEAVTIMKRLWTEEFVNFEGKYYNLHDANLYMHADVPIYLAGFGPKMARLAGKQADGVITVIKPLEYTKNVLFPAIEEGARSSGRSPDEITKVIELDVAYDEDYDKALSSARCLAPTLVPDVFNKPYGDPRKLELLGKDVTDKEIAQAYLVGISPDEQIARIEEAFRTGFDHVYIWSVGPDEEKFIKMYKQKVLPYFGK
jgi:coenzyme F420-dependent glucose-6-phosphate dehydrogenase